LANRGHHLIDGYVKINYVYLDITIHKTPMSWKTSIYRKPTFTDTIIPYSSNHPAQHKYAAIRFMYNRLNTFNLHEEEYKIEEATIQNITFNNAFSIHLHNPLPPPPYTYQHLTRQTNGHYITKMDDIHLCG